ncbi:hypothetical protein [Streptomyces sp. NPDC003863]
MSTDAMTLRHRRLPSAVSGRCRMFSAASVRTRHLQESTPASTLRFRRSAVVVAAAATLPFALAVWFDSGNAATSDEAT